MKTYALHTLAAMSLSISPRIYSSLTFLMSFAVDFEERDTVTIKRFIYPKCFAQFSLCIDKNLYYGKQSTFSRKLVHDFFLHREGSNEWFLNCPVFNDKLIATEKILHPANLHQATNLLSILRYSLTSGKMFNDGVT